RLPGITDTAYNAPRNENRRFAFRNEQLLLDDEIIVDLVTPARPRLVFEGFKACCAIGMNYVWPVALRRNRKRSARRFQPRVKAVHEHHSSRWRCRCREYKRVITAAANPGDRATCESAEAVRLDPLGLGINWIHDAKWNRCGTVK